MDISCIYNGIIEKGVRNVPEGYEKDGLIHCPECHTPRQTVITNPFTGEEAVVGCVCKCQQDAMRAEERRQREKERKARLRQLRLDSFEESDCASMTFENDDLKAPELSKRMRAYAEHFATFKAKGQGLILFGDVGTGKTFYSACIANRLIDDGYTVLMTNFPSLIARIQRDQFKDTDYSKLLNVYDLLIVDDLGVERSSEYMQEQVYNIVDARYRAKKPLLISTNLTADELKHPKDVMAARIYGRILERCLPIKVDGADRRKRNTCYKEMQAILNGEA